jgi:hypothetical protein
VVPDASGGGVCVLGWRAGRLFGDAVAMLHVNVVRESVLPATYPHLQSNTP